MQAMGNLSHKNKLTARTSPEVVEGVDLLLARRTFASLKFRGRKIGKESLIGAVMLEFLELPESDQLATLRRRLPQLESQVEAAGDDDSPPVVEGERQHTNKQINVTLPKRSGRAQPGK